jgi:hypothetical protein
MRNDAKPPLCQRLDVWALREVMQKRGGAQPPRSVPDTWRDREAQVSL